MNKISQTQQSDDSFADPEETQAAVSQNVPNSQSTPTKDQLKLKLLDSSKSVFPLSSNTLRTIQSSIVQDHHASLVNRFDCDHDNVESSKPSPSTKSFMSMMNAIVSSNQGKRSLLSSEMLQKSLTELGSSYSGYANPLTYQNSASPSSLFSQNHTSWSPASWPLPALGKLKDDDEEQQSPSSPFPESKFKSDGISNRSIWFDVPKQHFPSYLHLPDIPNMRTQRTDAKERDGKHYYIRFHVCRHFPMDCEYYSRTFFFLSQPIKHVNEHKGPVVLQEHKPHTCKTKLSYKESYSCTDKRVGLSNGLKILVDDVIAQDPIKRPKPNEVFRRVKARCLEDSYDHIPPEHEDVIRNKMKWHVHQITCKKKISGHTIDYVCDVPEFKNKFAFCHSVKERICFTTYNNSRGERRFLHLRDMMKVNDFKIVPHTLSGVLSEHGMMVLPIPPANDPLVGQNISRAMSLDSKRTADVNKSNPGESSNHHLGLSHMVPFSSINLLSLVYDAHHIYGNKLMMNIDTTWKIYNGDGKIMSFGYVTMRQDGNNSEYRQRYNPVIFAIVWNENEETAIYLLETLRFWIRELFGFTMAVTGGLVSDQADCFINAYKLVFKDSPRAQCYPHVVMKVKDQAGKRKSKQNAAYIKYANDRKNLALIHEDITRSHRCKTRSLQRLNNLLSARYWREELGEDKVASVFLDSYDSNPEHVSWRYNELGLSGSSPHINSLERFHLDMKGTGRFEGLVSTGRSLHSFLLEECPKLIFFTSSKFDGLRVDYKIRNHHACKQTRDLMKQVLMLSDGKNHLECENGRFAMNDIPYTGCKLDRETIDRHVNLRNKDVLPLSEDGSIKAKDRLFFYKTQDQMCFVEKKVYPDGVFDWCCECETFVKHTICAHAYYLKYGGVQSVDIPSKKGKNSTNFDQFQRREVTEAHKKVDSFIS